MNLSKTMHKAFPEGIPLEDENKNAAVKGGSMAGKARKLIEEERGEKVVSENNYLKTLKEDGTKELNEDPLSKKVK